MQLSADQIEQRRLIRDAYALDPLVSVHSLKQHLEKRFREQYVFSVTYVQQLSKKVKVELKAEIKQADLKEELIRRRETNRLMRAELLKIIHWSIETAEPGSKAPTHMQVIRACEKVVRMDIKLINDEAKAGIYDKPLEKLDRPQYKPLPPEVRNAIIAAWERGGVVQ